MNDTARNKTLRLTVTAMLCALAFLAVAVCRIPVVMFLKYEPKDVVVTLGGFMFGPLVSLVISVVVSLIEMVTISETGFIGFIMNVISTCSFACVAALIYKKKKSTVGAAAGLAVGGLVMVAAMLLWNYLISPLYMGVSRAQVAAMLIPAFLPFNLIKAGLNCALTFVIYKPLAAGLGKAGLIQVHEDINKKTPAVFFVIAGAVVVVCVFAVLHFNDII